MNDRSMNPDNAHILTINGGSSSIKFAQFEAGDSLRRILEGGSSEAFRRRFPDLPQVRFTRLALATTLGDLALLRRAVLAALCRAVFDLQDKLM